MRFLLIDPCGLALDIALRAQEAGHKVKHFIRQDHKTEFIGRGLVEVVDDFRPWLNWADLTLNSDNTKYLVDIEARVALGEPIVSATRASAAWELDHYGAMRRWAPAFLAAFSFQGGPAAASLFRAVDLLRDTNEAGALKLPKSAPTGFIRERWARYVMPGGEIDRRYYEFCVLSELCGRLRAGDVWVVGSRRYRSFEEHLISREAQQELLQNGTLPVAVDPDFERFIAGRRALLDARLAAVDTKAKGGLLPDVSLEKGVLKIAPIEKSTPPEAEALAARLCAMLPRIRITDLLSEVARWTLLTLPPECARATAMPINPCTGAPGATPHWTCIAANPPGHASPPGAHGTGGKRSLPAGRPVRPVYQQDQLRTREGYRGHVKTKSSPRAPARGKSRPGGCQFRDRRLR